MRRTIKFRADRNALKHAEHVLSTRLVWLALFVACAFWHGWFLACRRNRIPHEPILAVTNWSLAVNFANFVLAAGNRIAAVGLDDSFFLVASSVEVDRVAFEPVHADTS